MFEIKFCSIKSNDACGIVLAEMVAHHSNKKRKKVEIASHIFKKGSWAMVKPYVIYNKYLNLP